MEKGQTKNKKGLFGLFATLALALGFVISASHEVGLLKVAEERFSSKFAASAKAVKSADLVEEGTYTISTLKTGYYVSTGNYYEFTNKLIIQKPNPDSEDIYVYPTNIALNAPKEGISHANTISIGVNDSTGGSLGFYVSEGTYITSLKLNNVQGLPGAKLRVNNQHEYIHSVNNTSVEFYPYSNFPELITINSRVWFDSIEITVKNVENAALDYANLFLSETGVQCLNFNVLEETWDELGDIYIGMDNEVIAEFTGVVANTKGNALEQAVARYTYIVNKYKYDDFMDFGLIQDSTNQPVSKNTSNSVATLTLLVGILGLTTLVGLYFLKRKKVA